MNKFFTLLLSVIISVGYSQVATVGLISYDNRVADGYTILSTHHSTTTYLIDNCGFVVHTWESEYYPGVTAKLLPNGDLLRATRINAGFFIHGGTGGRIEVLNWDGTIKWEFTYASAEYRHHHDVQALKNGNILLLAWDRRPKAEALASGRNPALLNVDNDDTWGEHFIEVKPLSNNEYEIVWEWYVWDHLVQDYDSAQNNFGVIAESPELIDINFISGDIDGSDLVHANGFSYNESLDQIILSSRNYNEFWIIDHSTTTQEAKSHVGGVYGMGGDIIYRYGNPQAYDQGTIEDKKLFGQHNVHWTGSGYNVMLFNNGYNRGVKNYSTVDFLNLPVQNNKYFLEFNGTYGPTSLSRTYDSRLIDGFEYSGFISGAIELANDNILICSGAVGNLVEITKDGEPVWNYINPITSNGIVEQGFSIINEIGLKNLVFRAYKYASNYIGLDGKILKPTTRIEVSPFEIYPCEVIAGIGLSENLILSIYPNPTVNELNIVIDAKAFNGMNIVIVDMLGNRKDFGGYSIINNILKVEVGELGEGTYILNLMSEKYQASYKFVVAK